MTSFRRAFSSLKFFLLIAALLALAPGRAGAGDVAIYASPASPVEYGVPVTFTAVAQPGFMDTWDPSGSVAFLDNGFPVQFPNNNIPATAASTIAPMALSGRFGCLLTLNGPVCFGVNEAGQFGNNATNINPSSGDIVSLPPFNLVTSIATGEAFACAVVKTSSTVATVKCWGSNTFGQLGDTTKADRLTPVDVVDLNFMPRMVAVGDYHACALSTVGTVKCWGANSAGQLGNGVMSDPRTSPVDVVGLSGVVSIAARENRTCALLSTAVLKCWGHDQIGLTGVLSGDPIVLTPTEVVGLAPGVASVSMGAAHICVVTTVGGAKCWGINANGELGIPVSSGSLPVDVTNLTSGVAAIAAGYSHTCALLTNGGVKCWGANGYGQLGLFSIGGPAQDQPINYVIGLSSGAVSIAAGKDQTCVQMPQIANQIPTGGVKCWGDNTLLQVGVPAAFGPLPAPFYVGSTINQPGAQAIQILRASFTTSSLPVGIHTIDATLNGANNNPMAGAPTITFEVVPGTTTTTLSGGGAPILAGEEATFVATVTANGNTSGGAVSFYDGTTLLGTSFPFGGVATLHTTKLLGGMRTITAIYSGDAGHNPSTSAPVMQIVNTNTSVTTLSSTPNPSRPQQPVTFTAQAAAASPGTGVAQDGSVTFKEGATVLGTVPISNGIAQLGLSSLLLGNHAITAQFNSPLSFGPSNAVMNHLVEARVGGEMRVSQFNLGGQRQRPAVARAGGRFMTVWQSDAQDGAGSGIIGQRHRNDGSKIDGEFRVNTTTAKNQTLPAIAGLKDEGFIVVWVSLGQDGAGSGIIGQRFGSNGKKAGAEFIVNVNAKGNQSRPAVAGLADGGFVVAWDGGGDGSGLGVFARRFSKTGKPMGNEFQVNTYTNDDQTAPTVAAAGKGFVIAWQSNTQDKGAGIFGQRFKKNASKDGFEFRINTRVKGNQTAPALAALSNGGFVVAWVSDDQDGSGLGIYGQRFLISGNRIGEEFRINTTTALDQSEPSISGYDNGGFVVVWTSQSDGDGTGIFGQAFNSDGTPANGEFRANTTVINNQWQPSVATLNNGGFITVWSWRSPDRSTQGIYGQRLGVETH